jgi:hypothetical protein
MKKFQLFVILLVVIILFVLADYHFNVPSGLQLPQLPQQTVEEEGQTGGAPIITHPNITQLVLDGSALGDGYKLEKRSRTTELFEIFDLSKVSNISTYSNLLLKTADQSEPFYVYEIHGPEGQGKITYLNIKLQMVDQLGSSAGINETGNYGYNSLFYNDESNPNTGFLLSQVEDVVLGFRYNKSSENVFDSVKQFVEYYMSQITN